MKLRITKNGNGKFIVQEERFGLGSSTLYWHDMEVEKSGNLTAYRKYTKFETIEAARGAIKNYKEYKEEMIREYERTVIE